MKDDEIDETEDGSFALAVEDIEDDELREYLESIGYEPGVFAKEIPEIDGYEYHFMIFTTVARYSVIYVPLAPHLSVTRGWNGKPPIYLADRPADEVEVILFEDTEEEVFIWSVSEQIVRSEMELGNRRPDFDN